MFNHNPTISQSSWPVNYRIFFLYFNGRAHPLEGLRAWSLTDYFLFFFLAKLSLWIPASRLITIQPRRWAYSTFSHYYSSLLTWPCIPCQAVFFLTASREAIGIQAQAWKLVHINPYIFFKSKKYIWAKPTSIYRRVEERRFLFIYQIEIILLTQWKITLDKIEYYLQPKYHP